MSLSGSKKFDKGRYWFNAYPPSFKDIDPKSTYLTIGGLLVVYILNSVLALLILYGSDA